MIISRPHSPPCEFEGIPNCFVGEIDGSRIYPPGKFLASDAYPPVEVIFEVDPESAEPSSIEISVDSLRAVVAMAFAQ